MPRPTKVKRAKLSEQDVREIRARYRRRNGRRLANEYHVDTDIISNIVRRKTWTWVK